MSVSKWRMKAKEFAKLGRLNVALHCWARALEEDPKDDQAWVNKGITLEKLGKHLEAVDCYTQAININPKLGLAWYNKGALLGNFGQYREALGCFMEAERQGHPHADDAVEACRKELGDDVLTQKDSNPLINQDNESGTTDLNKLSSKRRTRRRFF